MTATETRTAPETPTSPYHQWRSRVIDLAGCTDAAARPHSAKLTLWWNAGEPDWMAADSLKLLVKYTSLAEREESNEQFMRSMIKPR